MANDGSNLVSFPAPDRSAVQAFCLKVAGAALLLYLCYLVREIWLPLGLAFLLAMILDPVVDRMETRGWKRTPASAFIFASFLLIVAGFAVLAYPYLVAQVSGMQVGFSKYFPDPSPTGLQASFQKLGLSPGLASAGVSAVDSGKDSLAHSSQWLTNYGLALASNAIWIVIVPIVAFYALRDFHLILAKGLLLVPAKRRDAVQTGVSEATSIFSRYLRGLGILSLLNGTATAVLLTILGVPGGLVLGVIAGLLYSVPYIGALVTIVLTAAVAFVGGGPNMLLWSVGLSVILHQVIFDQIITPRILGAHVGLHPILSILALLVGNLLLGIIGMVLAVPIAACLQIAVLAVVPKLSKEIDIAPGDGDTIASLSHEIDEAHEKAVTTTTMLDSVIAAVEKIESEDDPDQPA